MCCDMLQQELVSLVLDKLEDAKDLVRCAAVNKTWGAAAVSCQPRTLDLTHTTFLHVGKTWAATSSGCFRLGKDKGDCKV